MDTSILGMRFTGLCLSCDKSIYAVFSDASTVHARRTLAYTVRDIWKLINLLTSGTLTLYAKAEQYSIQKGVCTCTIVSR